LRIKEQIEMALYFTRELVLFKEPFCYVQSWQEKRIDTERCEDMQRPIVGFHQDEEHDWVADLACGHTQHVRHDPPWTNRFWVIAPAGRAAHLGQLLFCKTCDQAASQAASQAEKTLHE
jgi:hypothetical protein